MSHTEQYLLFLRHCLNGDAEMGRTVGYCWSNLLGYTESGKRTWYTF